MTVSPIQSVYRPASMLENPSGIGLSAAISVVHVLLFPWWVGALANHTRKASEQVISSNIFDHLKLHP